MEKLLRRWPLVWHSTYDRLRTERNVLLDALREANNELRKHRKLIGDLHHGHNDTARTVERILERGRS